MKRAEKRPWRPHPFQDWLNGALFARLTAADKGAIMNLADHVWTSDDGNLPIDDDDLMAKWSGIPDWNERKDRIFPALNWYLCFIRRDREEYAAICRKRQKAGREGGLRSGENRSKCQANAKQMLRRCEAQTIPIPTPPNQHITNPPSSSPTETTNKVDEEEGRGVFQTRVDGGRRTNKRITADDLKDPAKLEVLYRRFAVNGTISTSEADRRNFYAAAVHALNNGDDPGNLFVWIVNGKQWRVLTDEDDDAAREVLKRDES